MLAKRFSQILIRTPLLAQAHRLAFAPPPTHPLLLAVGFAFSKPLKSERDKNKPVSRNAEVARKMNEKILAMKETLHKSTPRSFAILFLLSLIPTFYFVNELMEK